MKYWAWESCRRDECLIVHSVLNKHNCETTSKQHSTLFKGNPKGFLHSFVAAEETWNHWYIPETKGQLKQWTLPARWWSPWSTSTTLRTAKWSHGSTILYYWAYSTYNCRKKGFIWLLHHENAPAHTSAVVTDKLVELVYELLPHPPYLPDVAPRNLFLLPHLKVIRGIEIWVKRGGYRRHEDLPCRPPENVFFGQIKASLGQVYRARILTNK